MKFQHCLFFLIVALASCNAQVPPGPKLVVEDGATFDFGPISHTARPEHRFTLRNTSTDTVRIVKVHATCGCTATMVSGSTLPPGASATVDVRFTPPRTSNGRVSKSISVFTENDLQKQYVLRIEADIRSAFTVMPKIVALDTIITRNIATATLTLTNVSADTQRIHMVQGTLAVEYRGYDGTQPPQLFDLDGIVTAPEQFVLAPGSSQEITVRFTPTTEGRILGSVVMYAKDESRQVEITGIIRRP
ncbi:MAG: DUF1573 domain-containing protein [Bacteroidota bacterium]|jgi:hypothetical protein|nr:DUF1573 domain-containing protein [Bacteroidota bacterium]